MIFIDGQQECVESKIKKYKKTKKNYNWIKLGVNKSNEQKSVHSIKSNKKTTSSLQ
jgi:hypothetical protein